MCKIMMLAGIKPSKVPLAWKWSVAATPLLCKDDHDGFGYAAAADGEIFGERWLDCKEAMKVRNLRSRAERFTEAQFQHAVSLAKTYNRFGDTSLFWRAQAIMLHARMATCAKNMRNTHPFVLTDDDGNVTTALIHNGIISNSDKLQNLTSSCDSECILNEYGDSNVAKHPENIQDVADLLHGYYACGVLSHNGTEQIMDVFKSERASLFVAYVPRLRCHVFCTSAEILAETAKRTKMRLGSIARVYEGNLIRISVATGRCLSINQFEEESAIAEWKMRVRESDAAEKQTEPIQLAANRGGR